MYQLDANNFTMIFSHKWPLHGYQLTNSAQHYTPTPQDHSLNTYGITSHAAVKQPIHKNS